MKKGVLIFGLFIVTGLAVAAPKSNSKKSETEISFEDLLVKGQYHMTDEAVTTVEDDKVLDALFDVRKDFKDRLRVNAKQY